MEFPLTVYDDEIQNKIVISPSFIPRDDLSAFSGIWAREFMAQFAAQSRGLGFEPFFPTSNCDDQFRLETTSVLGGESS